MVLGVSNQIGNFMGARVLNRFIIHLFILLYLTNFYLFLSNQIKILIKYPNNITSYPWGIMPLGFGRGPYIVDSTSYLLRG